MKGKTNLTYLTVEKVYKNKCRSAKILLTIKQSNAIDC